MDKTESGQRVYKITVDFSTNNEDYVPSVAQVDQKLHSLFSNCFNGSVTSVSCKQPENQSTVY